MNHCFVTVCDEKYSPGVFFLISSARYNNVNNPFKVYGIKLSDRSIEILEQFTNVEVFNHTETSNLPPTLLKVEALKLGINDPSIEYMTWLDADCLICGNISKYIEEKSSVFRIRMRAPLENQLRFKKKYQNESCSGIPKEIVSEWSDHLNKQSEELKMNTTCATNFMTVSRDQFSIINLWKEQIYKIQSLYLKGLDISDSYLHSSGLGVSDELVLSSILAFKFELKEIGEYKLDKNPKAYLYHFIHHPKPWLFWHPKNLNYYNYFMTLFDWIDEMKFQTINRKWYMKRKYKVLVFISSYIYLILNKFRRKIYNLKESLKLKNQLKN
jgi:hypothetical protein